MSPIEAPKDDDVTADRACTSNDSLPLSPFLVRRRRRFRSPPRSTGGSVNRMLLRRFPMPPVDASHQTLASRAEQTKYVWRRREPLACLRMRVCSS